MLNKSELSSLDFVIKRLFMKLFKTNNIETVEFCQDQFGFDKPMYYGRDVSVMSTVSSLRRKMPFVSYIVLIVNFLIQNLLFSSIWLISCIFVLLVKFS